MELFIENTEVWAWKSYKNSITMQPRNKEIDINFAKKQVIPEIAKRYGTIEAKKQKIKDLQSQIDKIELSILATKKDVDIKILKSDECPF